jgi:integrase
MARAKPKTTKYSGVYKRETPKLGTRYDIVLSVNGKQHWIRGKHTNLEAAQKHRIRLLNEAQHGALPDSTPKTFGVFADEWLTAQEAAVTQGGLRSSTVNGRKHELRCYLRPTFGEQTLNTIGVAEVERFLNALSARGLSNHTVLRLSRTLGTILEAARRHGHITSNPVRDAQKPPAKRKREPQRLTPEQAIRLAEAASEADERNLILVAAFAGLRQSELFGLRWRNVLDLTEGKELLLVDEQCYQGEVVNRPKTPAGFRQVVICPEAAEALRSQRIEGRSSDAGLVFPSPDGTHWRASNFNRRRWQPIREKAGHPALRFHDLRHFFVSYVVELKLSPALTQQLVGHTDERTHRSYTYALPETEPTIREAFAAETAKREKA